MVPFKTENLKGTGDGAGGADLLAQASPQRVQRVSSTWGRAHVMFTFISRIQNDRRHCIIRAIVRL